MLGTAGEVRKNSYVTISYGFLYMDTPVLVNQQRLYRYWMLFREPTWSDG